MNINRFISNLELARYGEISNLSLKSEALLNQQKSTWKLASDNFSALDNVKIKKFEIGKTYLNVQFNPSRITSSSAKVDKKSIENRACFLCEDNLPSVQKGIKYENSYVILCNPYPIFRQHLTIPSLKHVPQNIETAFLDLINLSYDLRDNFFVFYNGPKCGASAPDHLHFQAGLKGSTPLELFLNDLINDVTCIFNNGKTKIDLVTEKLYKLINIRSDSKTEIEISFRKIIKKLKHQQNSDEEPLLNITSFYENNYWNLFVVPRQKHRPDQFFLDGESKMLISPASVDVAGLLITPRENDFDKLNSDLVLDIYNQVLYDDKLLEDLKEIF